MLSPILIVVPAKHSSWFEYGLEPINGISGSSKLTVSSLMYLAILIMFMAINDVGVLIVYSILRIMGIEIKSMCIPPFYSISRGTPCRDLHGFWYFISINMITIMYISSPNALNGD